MDKFLGCTIDTLKATINSISLDSQTRIGDFYLTADQHFLEFSKVIGLV